MSKYYELRMHERVEECLKTVAVVLSNNKSSAIAAADRVSHRYEDKYLLANHLTNMSIACVLNGLELIGVSRAILETFKAWNSNRAVSLKFSFKTRCKFIKEIERDVEDPTRVQVDAGIFRSTVKVITKVKEYVYLIEEDYVLSAHSGVGNNPAEVIEIVSASSQLETTVPTNSAPYRESTMEDCEVNISWLPKHLDEAASTATFSVDRSHASCFTPRQNADVETALQFHCSFESFCGDVFCSLYEKQVRHVEATAAKFDMDAINTNGIFNPIMPLFEESPASEQALVVGEDSIAPSSVALSQPVVNQLVQEQRRSLAAKCTQVASLFSATTETNERKGLFHSSEATLMVVILHLQDFHGLYRQGVDFIEHMIRQQLVAAVGKELTARDFALYMTFHNRKVFKEAYQPQPFSYAVRRCWENDAN